MTSIRTPTLTRTPMSAPTHHHHHPSHLHTTVSGKSTNKYTTTKRDHLQTNLTKCPTPKNKLKRPSPTIPLTERPADPNHPAHPEHPKVIRSYISSTDAGLTKEQHGEWIKNAGKKFGNAAIFGAGATAGRDAIQGAINQV